MELIEKQISTKEIYDGKVIHVRVDDVLLENGETAIREIVEHGGAACVIPIDDNGNVYMVKQFRYAFGEVMLEIPAGKLDPGEQPIDCANRELEEEIGMKAKELTYLGELRPSVAIFTERIHMYLAKGLVKTSQHLDDDEFLEVYKMPLDELFDKVMKGKIKDAKTAVCILKAKALEK